MAEKQEAAEETAASSKGGRLKLVLLAVAGLLVLAGAAVGAGWFFGFFGSTPSTAADAGGDHGPAAAEPGATGKPEKGRSGGGHGEENAAGGHFGTPQITFLELPTVLVNLQSSGKRLRYLKIALALEVADAATADRLRGLTPRIMDSIQLYLRALTVDDVEGAIGMEKLKLEMAARINRAVAPLRVESVLIKEMLVQ